MNKNVVIAIVGIVFLVIGYVIGVVVPVNSVTGPKLKSDVDTFAYSLGYDTGNGLSAYLAQMDLNEDFSKENFVNGIKHGFDTSATSLVNKEEMQMLIQSFIMKKQSESQEKMAGEAIKNLKIGEDFLAENKNKEGIKTTESGLQYEVITEGTGATPNAEDTVVVHYTGSLLDGKVFDSSVERGEPATFPLNRVIPGWTEAIQLMKEGAKYKFYIPSELAYGERGAGQDIPGNSTLIFEVELIEVVK
jgi:FKBP-type peptidyl-prolyl cis-trans isomerase